MAIIKKVKLPDGTTHDVNDARITGIDNTPVQNSTNVVTSGGLYTELIDVVHQGDTIGSATYEDSGTVVDLTDYVREDNLKTINNQSLLGSGNITISGGGTQAQSDWEQNDNTQVDYIKNRTHYLTNGTEKELLAQDGFIKSTRLMGTTLEDIIIPTSGSSSLVQYNSVYKLKETDKTSAKSTGNFYAIYEKYASSSSTFTVNTTIRIEFTITSSGGISPTYTVTVTSATCTNGVNTGQLTVPGLMGYTPTITKIPTYYVNSTDSVQSGNKNLVTSSGVYTSTQKLVSKSGSTEMSNNAELVFPSEDWDEENDTGYATKINHQGVHCYDPDDGFELHMDGTDGGFISGSYSGQHTSYVNGAIGYSPSSSTHYTYSFPSKSGTFAMASDIPNLNNYVSKDGGSMNPNKSLIFTEGDLFYNIIKHDGITMDNDDDGFYVKISSTGPYFKISQGASQNIFTEYTHGSIIYRNADNTNISPFVLAFPLTSGMLAVRSDIPDSLSDLSDDSTHRFVTDTEKTTWNNKVSNVQSDWNATSGLAQILNKPTLATVATSGSYNDLSNKPTIPSAVTESTVSGWGFTKNTGTYSKPSGGIPKTDLASAVQTSLGKADTALQSYTETDPTVPAWAKAATKPTYTAAEVGALPNTTVIPATTSALTNDSGFKKITISSSEPTSSDGVNGDIWIVI